MTFIAIEGPSGVGKSTLVDGLKRDFPDACFLHEPGATLIGRQMYGLIQDQKPVPVARWLLFAAGIAQAYHEIVEPALIAGKMVIADRWTGSTIVYQGIIYRVAPQHWIKEIGVLTTGRREPDLTVIMLDDPEAIYKRRVGCGDLDADLERTKTQVKAYEDYFRSLAASRAGIMLINTNRLSVEDVHRLVKTRIEVTFGSHL